MNYGPSMRVDGQGTRARPLSARDARAKIPGWDGSADYAADAGQAITPAWGR